VDVKVVKLAKEKALSTPMINIGAHRTFRYDIAPDGMLSRKGLVVEQGSDGMTLDAERHLYLTGNGVMVFDSRGEEIEQIRISDEKWTPTSHLVAGIARHFSSRRVRALQHQDAHQRR
jgi:sugar lactone lactonase YvrE